ncbi:MAG TPA: hypothetical protein VMT54_00885 [Candidatus Cybelea sp.]|nr:hypothetical protein [Candidatus Cybelea sp.]
MSDPTSAAELRLWTTDDNGARVLRGLTAEETAWYQEHAEKELAQRLGVSKPWTTPEAYEEDRAVWRELNRRHELARAQVIHVEDTKRIAEEEAKTKRWTRRR